MKHVLPHLIDTARETRDREAARLRQAQAGAAQALSTLQRLEDFRRDCLARGAAGTGAVTSGQALADQQRFVARLDDAIAMQRQQVRAQDAAAQSQQQRLLAGQQRLLAFQTLDRRQAATAAAREQKRLQRDSDEFAARAFARLHTEMQR